MKAYEKYMCISCCIMLSPLLLSAAPSNIAFTMLNTHHAQQQIGYVFAHGLGAQGNQATLNFKPYQKQSILCGPVGIFNFPDAKKHEGEFNARYVNLGQSQDIERLASACKHTVEQMPQAEGLVLVGISRGSATILNYAAQNKHIPIKAIVAEAPFDTLKSIVKHLMQRFYMSWLPFGKDIGMKIADVRFDALNTQGPFPLTSVTKIEKNIPILLVHSRQDRVIPIASSLRLYAALRNAHHEHVHILELASGDHGKLMLSGERQTYQNVTHAFYKKYNLPHDAECAARGQELLKQCQPAAEQVKKRLAKK